MERFSKIKAPLIVFGCSYLFFLANLAQNFSGPHDSIAYLNSIISGHPLFHQHHLLYHFTTHFWLVFMQPVFPTVQNFYIVEAYTALWGSGSLAIVYSLFKYRFNLPLYVAIAGTAIIAFSYGMWFYSVNIEVYAMPQFFILWALYVLSKTNFSHRDFIKVCLLNCMAILFHQINILFAIVVLYKLWEQRSYLNVKKALWQYALMGIVLVGGLYFLVGWVYEGNNNFAAWMQWIRGYTTDHKYWQPLSTTTPFHVAIGYSHAFVGGHYMFQLPVVEHFIQTSLPYHALHDEIFLSRKISSTTAEVLTALTFVMIFIMMAMIIRFIRFFRIAWTTFPATLPPILICGAVYSLFFCFWMPEILEFWILQTVLFWLVLIGTLQVVKLPYGIPLFPTVALLSALLFTVNYFGSIRWMQHIENDLYFQKVTPLVGVANDKDVIVVQDPWILQDFLEYYTKADDIRAVPWTDSLRHVTDSAITASLSNKGKVYIYPQMNSMYAPPDPRYIDSLIKVFGPRVSAYKKEDPIIWIIQ